MVVIFILMYEARYCCGLKNEPHATTSRAFYLKKTDWPSIINYASLCIDFLTASPINVNVDWESKNLLFTSPY